MKTKEKQQDYTMWRRKDFDALPYREWDREIGNVTAFVILPLKTKHDSGFRQMDIVPIVGSEPVCRCGGCSDVLHLGGILQQPPRCDWKIDCLPVSGLLRVFMHNYKMRVGIDLSSLDIFVENSIV